MTLSEWNNSLLIAFIEIWYVPISRKIIPNKLQESNARCEDREADEEIQVWFSIS